MKTLNLTLSLALLFLVSCSSSGVKTTNTPETRNTLDIESLRKECLEMKVALSCSQVAYDLSRTSPAESIRFYEKGCELKDEVACFNLASNKAARLEHNQNKILEKTSQIFGCYVQHSTDKNPGTFFQKQNKHFLVSLSVERSGIISQVDLDNKEINAETKRCIQALFSATKFITDDKAQRYGLSLLTPTSYKEEPGLTTKLLDSMK